MKFPKANTGPRHVLLQIVKHGELTLEEIIACGISTETKQRNKVLRVLRSLADAQCVFAVNGKYRAAEDAIAYAEDIIELETKKPKREVVGAPYQRPFGQAPELKGYTKMMYRNKRGYD